MRESFILFFLFILFLQPLHAVHRHRLDMEIIQRTNKRARFLRKRQAYQDLWPVQGKPAQQGEFGLFRNSLIRIVILLICICVTDLRDRLNDRHTV